MRSPLKRLLRARRRRLPGGTVWLQVIRRTCQFSVLALLFAIPTLSLYDGLRNQRDEVRIERRWDTKLVHGLVGEMESPELVTQSVRGSVWTFKARAGEREVIVSDPLAAVDFASAARDLWDPFLLTILVPLILTILLGRVFCGWICPADLLFEAGSKVRQWARIDRDVKFSRSLKYIILVLGSLAGAAMGIQVFALIYPPRVLSGELYFIITFGAFGAGAWFLLSIVAFEIFVSQRFWCRYVCPGGALYSWLGRARLVRLKVSRSACTECEKCLPVCEFDLDPMRGEIGQECNNCGLCVRACAPGALTWRVAGPPKTGLDVIQ